MEPALNPDEWRRLEWARSDGTNPHINRGGDLMLDGAVPSGPDELRAIIALANEVLRQAGQPCFTREMVEFALTGAYVVEDEFGPYEALKDDRKEDVDGLRNIASLLEVILPPEG